MINKDMQTNDNIIIDPIPAKLQSEIVVTLAAVSVCMRDVNLYGRFHPMTREAADYAFHRLTELLAIRPNITIAVTENYLAMGSFPLEDNSGSLAAFARMLHDRKVSELSICAGVTKDEIIEFAEVLSLSLGDLLVRGGFGIELRRRAVANLRIKQGVLPAESRLAKDPADIYEEALALVEEAMKAVQSGLQIAVADIRSVVSDSLQSLIADESALIALAGVRSYDRYLSEHSVNVCVLSMVLAKDLDLDVSAVLELGIGALLHDVGKVFIPNEIVSKPGKLSEQEWEQIKRHPIEGARSLAGLPDLPVLAPTIALQHHMHCDGTGYPSLPDRGQPHLVSRLVAIVDTYDALTTDRPYRQRWTSEQTIAWMIYEAWPQYDRQLLARFASRANLYPVGSLVRLKNGALATVVGGSYQHPHRPTLKTIVEGGINTTPMIIDLCTNTDAGYEIEAIAQPAEALLPYADLLATA